MPDPDKSKDEIIRETAYYLWEQAGCPEGRADEYWLLAVQQASAPPSSPKARKATRGAKKPVVARARDHDHLEDEEKVLAGRPDVNMPALLTKDVPGG